MGRMKELWCQVHEQLMEEWAEVHPDWTDEELAEATAPLVVDRIAGTGY